MRINCYSLDNSSDQVTKLLTFKKLLVSLFLILGSTYMSFAQPAAPVATAADNFTCTSFNANWQVVPGALSYYLDVSTDLSFATFLSSFNNLNVGNVLNFNISNLTPNINYYYRLRAFDGTNNSLNSNTILANTGAAAAPNTLAASNITCTAFDANWNTVSGAVNYYIDVSTSASFSTFLAGYNNLNVVGGNTTTVNVSGLTANTTYYYRLRAHNSCSVSINSNVISVLTGAPIAPIALAASNFTCTSMNANWSASSGALSYSIDISTDQNFNSFLSSYNNFNTGNVTTLLVTGLMTNTNYYYRVRSNNGCSTSLNSNTISVSTMATSVPTGLQLTNTGCSFADISWTPVNNATMYYLDVWTEPSFTSGNELPGYSNFNVGNVSAYTILGLSANTNYYLRVRSSNGCSSSNNSSVITFSTLSTSLPNAPTALAANNINCSSFNANWTAVPGASGYLIDVSTSVSFTSFVGAYNNMNVGNVATLNLSGLQTNTTYYYRIYTVDGCGTSVSSNTVTVNTSGADAPIALNASFITCTSFSANWNSVSGALSYSIDVSTDINFGTFLVQNLNVGNATTYTIVGITVNTTYYYRVNVTNSCATSAYSNTIALTIAAPSAPLATAATNLICTAFNANWSTVSGSLTYYLDVSTDPNFGTFIPGYNNLNVGNTTTYYIPGLQLNGTYYYRVRAANGCATSTNSNTVTVNTAAAATLNSSLTPTAICSGTIFSYTPTSDSTGTTFAWSRAAVSGISNAAASGSGNPYETLVNTTGNAINVTYVYSVTLNGCTNPTTYSVVVAVDPTPALSSSLTPPAIFTDHTFSYTPASGINGTTFSWTRAAVTGISNASAFGTDDPNEVLYNTTTSAVNVTYVYTLSAGGCTNPTTFSVVVTVNTRAVWPGDANNDSLVNNIDLLSVGLYHSQTGSPRSTVDNTWQAYVADNWLTLQNNGQDIKHADCNGDGTIDSNDTLAINLNYSLAHAISAPPVVFHVDERATSDMYFVISSSAFTAGDWVDVELWLGSQAAPLTGLYGIAFDIDYDASFVQSGTEAITYQPSWLGTPGTDALTINQVDALANKAYGAVTRTDQAGRNGYGKIATFKFQVKNSLSSVDTMHFAITSYMAIDSVGVTRALTTSTDSIGVNPLSTGIQAKNNVPKVNIAPNPFALNTTISFNTEVKNASVKVIDVLGKEVKTLTFTGKQLTLEKGELNAGIYSVKIVSENNILIATEKVVIQ